MTIQPIKNIVYLKTDSVKVGVLDTSSRPSAVEFATVVAIGEGVSGIQVGDNVFVKSWAIDTISHEEEQYRFVNVESGGILAIVKP